MLNILSENNIILLQLHYTQILDVKNLIIKVFCFRLAIFIRKVKQLSKDIVKWAMQTTLM